MGVKDVDVEDLWDLDNLTDLHPVCGLIFLFKWDKEHQFSQAANAMELDDFHDPSSPVFFAKQVINNACATQAIVSVLFNRADMIDLGSELSEFRELVQSFPPDMKGLALSNNDHIRMIHNSFARSDPFVNDGFIPSSQEDDAFHFVSYVPVQGKLYELDGLKDSPIILDECTEEDWLDKVRPIIDARMAEYGSNEIRFNLLAVVKSRLSLAQQKYDEVYNRAQQTGKNETDEALRFELFTCETEIEQARKRLTRYKKENSRRKHNFIPFTFALLQKMAEKRILDVALVKAEDKVRQQRAERVALKRKD